MSVNFKPYGASYDHETRASTIFDRCFRPIIRAPGRWPRIDRNAAVACDPLETRCYRGERTFFYHGDHARICDPVVRQRLAQLSREIPALGKEVARRTNQAAAASKPVELISMTFG
jgi:hypothetical protein